MTEIIEMVKKGRNQWHTIHLFKLKNYSIVATIYTYFSFLESQQIKHIQIKANQKKYTQVIVKLFSHNFFPLKSQLKGPSFTLVQ